MGLVHSSPVDLGYLIFFVCIFCLFLLFLLIAFYQAIQGYLATYTQPGRSAIMTLPLSFITMEINISTDSGRRRADCTGADLPVVISFLSDARNGTDNSSNMCSAQDRREHRPLAQTIQRAGG